MDQGATPAYIQSFNIYNFAVAALAAWGVARVAAPSSFDGSHARVAAVGFAAGVVFVGVNHVLLAPMIRLARRVSFRDSGLFSFESLSSDVVLAALGVACSGGRGTARSASARCATPRRSA